MSQSFPIKVRWPGGEPGRIDETFQGQTLVPQEGERLIVDGRDLGQVTSRLLHLNTTQWPPEVIEVRVTVDDAAGMPA